MDNFQIAVTLFGLLASGFAWVVWSKIDKAANDAEQAKADAVMKSEAAKDEAMKKADAVKDDLADFKLHVAREHPIRNELISMSNKMDAGFKAIFDKMDQIGKDLNQMGNGFRDLLDGKEDRKK